MSELFWYGDTGAEPPPPPPPITIIPVPVLIPTRQWEFVLARSSDLAQLGTLTRATNRRLSLILNEPGSFQFSMPLDDPVAPLVQAIDTCVLIRLDEEPVWSGPVWTMQSGAASQQFTVSCVGWYEQLNHRLLRDRKKFILVDAGQVVKELVEYVNSIHQTWITVGTVQTSFPRSGTYEQYTNLGRIIKDLSDIEAGFDMEVHPETRELTVWAAKIANRPQALFAYGLPPHNLADVQETIDGSTIANYVVATGQLGAGFAEDAPSQTEHGLWEDSKSLSDVMSSEILTAYAGVEVLLRAQPRVTYSLVPASIEASSNLPWFMSDFQLGDKVYFDANAGRLQVRRQAQRVFGIDLAWDQEGNDAIAALKTSL